MGKKKLMGNRSELKEPFDARFWKPGNLDFAMMFGCEWKKCNKQMVVNNGDLVMVESVKTITNKNKSKGLEYLPIHECLKSMG